MREYEVHTMNTLLIMLRMIIHVVVLHMILPQNVFIVMDICFNFISVQTIAPEGFCSIGGKPKPCKFVLKLKNKAQAQVDSFASWLQENDRPDVF